MASAAMSVSAQQDTVEPRGAIKVEVTGSNLRRIEGETALPLQVMTREELQRGGVQTVQDLLDRISANQSFGGFNEAMGEGNTLVGFTGASLRGLGTQRTLVLLNGRRLAPYALSGGQSVDLSGIPASAIERVEILKDGASAVYGTDAIGGVINFILRKDFEGAEINANYYAPQESGGDNWRASLTAGYGNLATDKFNVFVSADYFKQDPLKASQREFTRTSYLPGLGFDKTSGNSFPANIAQRPAIRQLANPTIPNPGGATPSSCLAPYSFPTFSAPFACKFDYGAVIETIPQAEKTNVVGHFTWQIDPANQFFAEATYYNGTFWQRISPTPVLPPPISAVDNTLPPGSPYYPAAFVTSLGGDPGKPLSLSYRTVELGPRTDQAKVDQWTAATGVQGTFKDWDYQLAGNWAQNQQKDYLTSGYVSDSRFGALMHSGVVTPFGVNPPDVLALMRGTQIAGIADDNKASNYGGTFKMSREFEVLPAGPLALALGTEGRRESLEQSNADFVATGDVSGYGGSVPSLTTAYRTVWALFGEVNIPIVKTLEANVAVRYDHYSDFGGTTNPKIALRWQPNRNVLLRASYGTGFRAPTLSDLHQPLASAFVGGFDDPIRCPVTHADYDCAVTNDTGLGFPSLTGGNVNLQPETSTQWNAGVVWEPSPELSVSVDYFQVEVRNQIFFASADTVFGNYAVLGDTEVVRKPPDAAYPALPGEIDRVYTRNINLGTLQTSGLDIDLKARTPATALGRFTFSLSGTYVFDYTFTGLNSQQFPGGAGSRGPLGAIARWRDYAALDWTSGPWGATLDNVYQSGYSEPCTTSDPSGCDWRRVGASSIWDAQARYTGFKDATLTVGIRNLMSTPPPVSNQGSSFQVNYDPSYGDPRGRTFYGAVRYAFK